MFLSLINFGPCTNPSKYFDNSIDNNYQRAQYATTSITLFYLLPIGIEYLAKKISNSAKRSVFTNNLIYSSCMLTLFSAATYIVLMFTNASESINLTPYPYLILIGSCMIFNFLFIQLVKSIIFSQSGIFSSIRERFKYFFITGFLYNALDDAIANILALETLRHSTSLFSVLRIRISGPNLKSPSLIRQHESESGFYVLKDTGYKTWLQIAYTPYIIADCLGKRANSLFYQMLVLVKFDQKIWIRLRELKSDITKLEKSDLYLFFDAFVTNLATIFMPTACILKFKMPLKSIKEMEGANQCLDDTRHKNHAWVLKKEIHPLTIGMFGNFYSGLNSDTMNRMLENKSSVALGVVQLIGSIMLGKYFLRKFAPTTKDLVMASFGAFLL